MPRMTIFHAAIFAMAATFGVAIGGSAHAAVTTPLIAQSIQA